MLDSKEKTTVKKLAEETNYTRATVSKYLNGHMDDLGEIDNWNKFFKVFGYNLKVTLEKIEEEDS